MATAVENVGHPPPVSADAVAQDGVCKWRCCFILILRLARDSREHAEEKENFSIPVTFGRNRTRVVSGTRDFWAPAQQLGMKKEKEGECLLLPKRNSPFYFFKYKNGVRRYFLSVET